MRFGTSGRGATPKITPDDRHIFRLDETTNSWSYLMAGGTLYATTNSGSPVPSTSSACGPRALSLDGSSYIYNTTGLGASAPDYNDGVSMKAVVFWEGGESGIFWIYASGETEAANIQALLHIKDSGVVRLVHEYGAGTDVDLTFDDYPIPKNTWTMIHVSALDNGSGQIVYTLALNGVVVETKSPVVKATGGSSAYPRLGRTGYGGFTGRIAFFSTRPGGLGYSADEIREDFERLNLSYYETVPHCKVEVKQNGSWLDVSDLGPGYDFLVGADVTENVDSDSSEAVVKIWRGSDWMNASPGITASPLNKQAPFAAGSSDDVLFDLSADVRVSFAVMPMDAVPSSGDWRLVFEGGIDDVDDTGEVITIKARDESRNLIMGWIEEETVMPSSGVTLLKDAVEDMIATAATEGWVPSAYTIYDPEAVPFAVNPGKVVRAPVLRAVTDLVAQTGSAFRWRWDETTETIRPTLYTPDRQTNTPRGYLTRYSGIRSNARSVLDVRNVVRIGFAGNDTSSPTLGTRTGGGTLSDGDYAATYLLITDDDLPDTTGSIARYGRQPIMITEGATSQIDTMAEAQAMAEAIIRDLREPRVTSSVDIDGLCFMPLLGDLVTLQADGQRYDVDQNRAVVSVRMSVMDGTAVTTLGLRGQPTARLSRHLESAAAVGGALPPPENFASLADGLGSRWSRGGVTSLLKKSELLARAKTAGILNSDFSSALLVPDIPDGWEIPSAADGYAVSSTTKTYHGGRSLKLEGSFGAAGGGHFAEASRMPVEEGRVYLVETLAQQDAAVSGLAYVQGDWHDATDTFISSFTTMFLTFAAANTWTHQRAYQLAPANARYLRIRLGASTGVANDIYIQRIQATPAREHFKTHLTTGSLAIPVKTWSGVIPFNTTDYDVGGVHTGGTFTAPRDGRYVFAGQVASSSTSGATLAAAIAVGGAPGTGTVIGQNASAGITGAGVTPCVNVTGEAVLTAGQTVGLYAYAEASAGNLENTGQTWFTGRLAETEG